MAKSGFNLNPGADPTLVGAAFRAAMANVPEDLSGTFEALATNYANTMKVVGTAWAGVAKNLGKMAGEAIDKYAKSEKLRIQGLEILDGEGEAFLSDALKETRKGILSTYLNNPFSDESKSERQRLLKDKAKFEAQITELSTGYTDIANKLATGAYDEQATGGNWRLINAVGAFKSSNGRTDDGDKVRASHDENGDIVLTLYDANDEIVMKYGKPVTIKSDDIDKLLVTANPEIHNNIAKAFNSLENSGTQNGRNKGHEVKVFRGNISKIIGTSDDNLHIAMNQDDLYLGGRSCVDELTNRDGEGTSVTSAELFTSLGGRLPTNEQGETLAIDTSYGDPNAFDEADLQNAENYNMLVNAIVDKSNPFYDTDTAKEVFLDWAERTGGSAFDYGTKRRTGSTNGGTTYKPLVDSHNYGPDKDVKGLDIKNQFALFDKGENFKSYDHKTEYSKNDDDTWTGTNLATGDETIYTEDVIADGMLFDTYRNQLGVSEDRQWKTKEMTADDYIFGEQPDTSGAGFDEEPTGGWGAGFQEGDLSFTDNKPINPNNLGSQAIRPKKLFDILKAVEEKETLTAEDLRGIINKWNKDEYEKEGSYSWKLYNALQGFKMKGGKKWGKIKANDITKYINELISKLN